MSTILKKFEKKIIFWGIVFLSMILIPVLSVCKDSEKSASAFSINKEFEKQVNAFESKENYFKIWRTKYVIFIITYWFLLPY